MNSEVRAGASLPREHTDSVAERLAALIRIATVSGGANPAPNEVFAEFRATLAQFYPLVHEHLEFTRVGPRGLQFTWAARPGGATDPLVLMAHADVVPAHHDNGWTHGPFDGVVDDGRVFGRGTLDDKGPLVVIFEAVESLIAEGFAPPRPVILSIGGDEETLGTGGIDAARAIAERGETPWLVLDEGGAVVDAPLPFAPGPCAMIGVGEKGYATVRLHAVADPGHASTPSRGSAPARIARALTRLDRRPFRARASRPVLAMLHTLASATSGPAAVALKALVALPAVTARLFAVLGGEPAALVRTTCAVTMLDAGSAPNVVAAEAAATINLRIAPGETVASTIRSIRRRIGDRQVAIEALVASNPTPIAPSDGDRFEALTDAVAESYPRALPVPYLVMATTDARHFQHRWKHVYRFAPIEMTKAQRASIHGVDEHVTVDSLERGIAFHRALISGAGGPAPRPTGQ